MGTVTTLWDYERPLEKVSSFKYLERLLTATGENWTVVITNIQKARKSWSRLARSLGREGADTRTPWCSCVAIVQAILLLGSETWVVTPHIKWILGGFHHRMARRILAKMPRRRMEGT